MNPKKGFSNVQSISILGKNARGIGKCSDNKNYIIVCPI